MVRGKDFAGFRIFFYDTRKFEIMTKKCMNHL